MRRTEYAPQNYDHKPIVASNPHTNVYGDLAPWNSHDNPDSDRTHISFDDDYSRRQLSTADSATIRASTASSRHDGKQSIQLSQTHPAYRSSYRDERGTEFTEPRASSSDQQETHHNEGLVPTRVGPRPRRLSSPNTFSEVSAPSHVISQIRGRQRQSPSVPHKVTKLDALSPVQRNCPETERPFPTRTRTRSSQRPSLGINEVFAPAPIQVETQPGRWHREEYLEDAPDEIEGEEHKEEEEEEEPDALARSKFAEQLYIHAYLVFFSFFGTLARIGIQYLTFYPGAPVVISNLWANFSGCLVMGFFSEDHTIFAERWDDPDRRLRSKKNPLTTGVTAVVSRQNSYSSSTRARHTKLKKTIPLYIGITTGFCGCFTSFSTFSRDMYFSLANDVATPQNHPNDPSPASSTISRGRGNSVLALLCVIILTLTVNIAALDLGAHVDLAVSRFLSPLSRRFARRILDPLVVILASIAWIGSVIACIFPPHDPATRGQVLFALPFSPVGCLFRYHLSFYLNPIVASFPLGTFVANIFGVTVLSMCYDLQHTQLLSTGMAGGGALGCQVLQGIQDGFCGCLTTVSTWVLELSTLRRRHAYVYGGTSVAVALAVTVLVMGSVQWSIGFVDAACAIVTS